MATVTSQRTTINARLHTNSLVLAIAITSVQVMDHTCNLRSPAYDDPCHRLLVCTLKQTCGDSTDYVLGCWFCTMYCVLIPLKWQRKAIMHANFIIRQTL